VVGFRNPKGQFKGRELVGNLVLDQIIGPRNLIGTKIPWAIKVGISLDWRGKGSKLLDLGPGKNPKGKKVEVW